MQTILATQCTASKNMPQLFQVKNAMAEQRYKEKPAEQVAVTVDVYIVMKQRSSNAKYVLTCYENNKRHYS